MDKPAFPSSSSENNTTAAYYCLTKFRMHPRILQLYNPACFYHMFYICLNARIALPSKFFLLTRARLYFKIMMFFLIWNTLISVYISVRFLQAFQQNTPSISNELIKHQLTNYSPKQKTSGQFLQFYPANCIFA